MSEFGLKAFSSEADVLNKGINRNIPNINNPLSGTSLDPATGHSIWNASTWSNMFGGGEEMVAHRNLNKLLLLLLH